MAYKVIILYQLYMPSYFLGTFTEYPYLLSAYVGWGRTYAKKHDWWDVIGGAAIGTASSYIFTRPFARKHNITFSPVILSGQHPGFYASIRF